MLTIVIPTKNEEAYLPRLLASIAQQTLAPAQVIVADAQSNDGTREAAYAYQATVVEGGAISLGRNAGAQHARTDLLLFLDADVELTNPMFLEQAVDEFLERKLDLATCDVFPLSSRRVDHWLHRAYNWYVRMWGATNAHIPGFCLLVRRSLFEQVGGFDESITFCEDHEFARHASKKGRFGFLSSVVIPVSIRRLERDGRLRIFLTFVLAEFHLVLLGPIRHNGFRYGFGHTQSTHNDKHLCP